MMNELDLTKNNISINLNKPIEKKQHSYKTVNCPLCNQTFILKSFPPHLIKFHNIKMENDFLSYKNYMISKYNLSESMILDDFMKFLSAKSLSRWEESFYTTSYTMFINIVSSVKIISQSDFFIFIDRFIPFRNDHKKITNCKGLYVNAFSDDEKNLGIEYYNKNIAPKNPYTNHGGKFSQFSTNFVKYEDMSVDEKEQIIKSHYKMVSNSKTINHSHIKKEDYYTSRGYTLEDAKMLISKSQKTFSLEKCIEKYGEVDGKIKWEARQKKWLKSLYDKSPEDIKKFHESKINDNYLVSSAEKDIMNFLKLDQKCSQVSIDNYNGYVYDIVFNDKIIEYHGDYWHCNPLKYDKNFFNKSKQKIASDIWKYDETKNKFASDRSYKVLVIWEHDYINDKENTLKKCWDFIYGQ